MTKFICPYCNHAVAINGSTHITRYPSFDSANRGHFEMMLSSESEMTVDFFKCHNCEEYTVYIQGTGECVETGRICVRPISLAKNFPEYIPLQIRQDYEEACAIEYLSPKASATLSRRCLQGMIHDFWKIKEKNLYTEITKLKEHVSGSQWNVIDAIRKLGNIGAHMERDVNIMIDIDPAEAHKFLQLIEKLIEQWYINRHDEEELYKDIIDIDEDKQAQRKSN